MAISLSDVQGRWGYSEIADGNASHLYGNDAAMEALRAKRRNNVPFDDLSTDERYEVAFMCACVRRNLFMFFVGIKSFDTVPLSRVELGDLWMPPSVWSASQGQWYRFADYIGTTTDEAGDARLVGAPAGGYKAPPDPPTVGRMREHRLLIDGYHRASCFWKYGPADGNLLTYVPMT
jgi:hypothetical protein